MRYNGILTKRTCVHNSLYIYRPIPGIHLLLYQSEHLYAQIIINIILCRIKSGGIYTWLYTMSQQNLHEVCQRLYCSFRDVKNYCLRRKWTMLVNHAVSKPPWRPTTLKWYPSVGKCQYDYAVTYIKCSRTLRCWSTINQARDMHGLAISAPPPPLPTPRK